MTQNGRLSTVPILVSLRTGKECSLSDILEQNVDKKYILSDKMKNYVLQQPKGTGWGGR